MSNAENQALPKSPNDLSVEELEALLAAKRTSETPAPVKTKYCRNLRGAEVHFRLSRQNASNGDKKVSLKPRGQRGDISALQTEDLNDTALIDQINYGLIEILSHDEARGIMEKQATNSTLAQHPALAGAITNAKGDALTSANIYEMAQPVHVGQVAPQSTRAQNPISRDTPATEGPAAGLPAGTTVTIAPVSTTSTPPNVPAF